MNKLKYYVDKVKSFHLVDMSDLAFILSSLSTAIILVILVYFYSEPAVKAPVEQTQIEKGVK